MVNETVANQIPSNCVVCGAPIGQLEGGHRRRRYCNNNNACKQAAHRLNKLEKQKEQTRERWAGFAADTQNYLEWLLNSPKYGRDFAEGVVRIIKHEADAINHERDHEWQGMTPDALRAAYHEALMTIAERERKIEKQQARNHKQQVQLEQAQHQLRILNGNLENTHQYAHDLVSDYATLQKRISELEQELTRYREVIDLSNRERLEQQFMAIGSQIGYKSLLVGVSVGVDSWMSFMIEASDEALVKAIASAKFYAENLIGLELDEQLRRANKRIAELEQQQVSLKAVS